MTEGGLTMKNDIVKNTGRTTMARVALVAGLSWALALPAQTGWYFEIGPFYRGDMEVTVRGGSRAADDGAAATHRSTTGAIPSLNGSFPTDDGTVQILREFDDGFVGPSGWPWAVNDGVTQFFGYNAPEQYDAAADTLTFQITLGGDEGRHRSTRTRTSSESIAWEGRRRTDGWGIMATLGHTVRREESWSLAAQVRLGWLDGLQANFRGHPSFRRHTERSVFETTVAHAETRTFTYDTLGNPAFPSAPYQMTNPSGVGPLIADTPTTITQSPQSTEASTRQVDRSSQTALSRVDLNVEAQAFTLQLGPRIQWNSERRISLLLQPALTLNLLDADMRRTETFRQANGAVISSWNDNSDKQSWRTGAGVQVGVQLALSEQWHVTAAGGYEWVDKYSLSVGPDRVHVDLSGYQLELALGRAF